MIPTGCCGLWFPKVANKLLVLSFLLLIGWYMWYSAYLLLGDAGDAA